MGSISEIEEGSDSKGILFRGAELRLATQMPLTWRVARSNNATRADAACAVARRPTVKRHYTAR